MAYFGENWDDAEFPLAYLITIRTFGTWLHGDERYSVDIHGDYNVFGAPRRTKNPNLQQLMAENMKAPAFILDVSQRGAVYDAITEVCINRGYKLHALNVRTNHAHAVTTAHVRPEKIADTFKAYATRKLRRDHLVRYDVQPWSRGRSRRYLWKPQHVDAAIDYVLYFQGDDTFDEWYGSRFDD